MSLYIYCPRKSQGALELVQALNATRLRRFDGLDFWVRGRRLQLSDHDIVVAWGTQFPEIDGVRVLNGAPAPINKLDEIVTLMKAGLPTVQVHQYIAGAAAGWMYRSNHHVGGNDLLNPPKHPDYMVVREKFVKEYRIHSFAGKSIRAGQKVLREGFTLVEDEKQWKPNQNLAHPWIRAFDAGWKISYDNFQSTGKMRTLAHKAVAAMGLTFGAVDIAEGPTGGLKVLEVNRAPGIEGNTVQSYVRAIQKWIKSEKSEEVEQ